MVAQNPLFTEPLYTETALFCELAEGIDSARWAALSRRLARLSPEQFKKAEKTLLPNPDSIISRLKRLFTFNQEECKDLPPVCIGPLPDKFRK